MFMSAHRGKYHPFWVVLRCLSPQVGGVEIARECECAGVRVYDNEECGSVVDVSKVTLTVCRGSQSLEVTGLSHRGGMVVGKKDVVEGWMSQVAWCQFFLAAFVWWD